MKSCPSRPKVVQAPDSAHLVSLDRRAPCLAPAPLDLNERALKLTHSPKGENHKLSPTGQPEKQAQTEATSANA